MSVYRASLLLFLSVVILSEARNPATSINPTMKHDIILACSLANPALAVG
jgi:hypothetical protein